jgi:hypothetical protein
MIKYVLKLGVKYFLKTLNQMIIMNIWKIKIESYVQKSFKNGSQCPRSLLNINKLQNIP